MSSTGQGLDIKNFIEIEKKYDLYHVAVEGINPWMYFRFPFWNYQLCAGLLGLSGNLQKTNLFQSYIRQIKSVIGIVSKGNAKRLCKADVLFYVHSRRIEEDGYFKCIYTGWLAERYGSHMAMEEPYKNSHLTPVREEHLYYTDFIQIKAALYAKAGRCMKSSRYRRIYTQIRERFGEPFQELGREYQYDIPYEHVYAQMTELVLEISRLKREMEKLLEKIEPKVIVEVVSYNKRCMVLNELAKGRGIPTVELQHGTMHAAHAAYQFPGGCGVIRQFPDYIFVFSQYWKRCAHLPIPDEHIRVTGYPYFERQIQKYAHRESRKGGRIHILFVSQGTIGKELSRLAADLCSLLDADKYHIIYKLHPGECEGWQDRTPWLIKDNIEVVDNARHSIYEYFSKCDIQVGVYSTAIYEGLGFGLATFIYHIGHADTMTELCEQGYAVSVENAEELYRNISHREAGGLSECDSFWQKDAENNICRELDQILAGRI